MNAKKSRTAVAAGANCSLDKSDYERLSHFRHRLRCFLRISEDLCLTHGVTSLQYQLLLHIQGFPGREWATVSELAEQLQARHNSVVSLVDRCESAGLVRRKAGTKDKRQVEVRLLAKGMKLLETLATLHQPELRWLQEEFQQPDDKQ